MKRQSKPHRKQEQPSLNLAKFAEHLELASSWEELNLPESDHERLKEIVRHIKHKPTITKPSGQSTKITLGTGTIAIFTGSISTGKTSAATVIANDLNLALYRVDLGSIASKYIGETEKNLQHMFEMAEKEGAILLFDEADALFGRRSKVKDSHDRYSNIEISYLLQRMESFQGLTILSSNTKSAFDQTFLSHVRFVVDFSNLTDF